MKQSSRTGGFVTLQMPDQVPGCRQITHGSALPFALLHPILAEVAQSRGIGHANGLGWVRLRHGDQRDFLGTTSGSLRRNRDAFLHSEEIIANSMRAHRGSDPNRSMCGFATPNVCV